METAAHLRVDSATPSLDGNQTVSTPVESSKNPLSLRLFKVLGARYDDPTTREALEILSDIYAPTSSSGKVEMKRSKVKDAGSDDSDEEQPVSSFASMSVMDKGQTFDDSAARARRSLRKDMENKLAQSSKMFLAAFSEVNQNLDTLKQQVDAMQIECDAAQQKIKDTNIACKHLLERADGLRSQRQAMSTKQAAILAFLARFTLTEKENDAIESLHIPVGAEVFAAIDRCERIREDCQLFANVDGGEPRVVAEIKALTDRKLETGYEKIFNWTQDEFRRLARDIHSEPSAVLREAVRRLRRRPALFNEALGSLSLIRQNTLLSSFLAALTKGGPGGYPRPIELHAHEPTRYVGDMLAWIHQATAGEREFLDGIFEVENDGRMVGAVRTFDKANQKEEEDYIQELLDSDLEKLCTPLRVRVQQTVKSQEGSITAYKITNLLQFYCTTMKRTIGEDALMSQTLKEITEMSFQVFFDTLRSHGKSLLRFLHPPDETLAPPLALRDSAMVLREIMQVYDSSLLDDETSEQRAEGFREVLEEAVKPMIEMCSCQGNMIKAPAGKEGDGWEKAIFMVNCLVYIEGVLQPFDFTAAKLKDLERLMDENVQIIVEVHYEKMLRDSGLSSVVALMEGDNGEIPLSRVQGCSSQNISSALQAFDTFLSTLDVHTSKNLALLSLPRLGTLIHRTALERIARAYGRLCNAVRDPRNKYEFSGTLLGSRRPFGQMSMLLQVLGLDQLESSDV